MKELVRKIEVGDLIQLDTWFDDAWSEVTQVFDPDETGKQMICHVRRDKYGTRNRNDYLTFANHGGIHEGVRRVEKAENVNPYYNNINFVKYRIRCGTLWDNGRQIGILSNDD